MKLFKRILAVALCLAMLFSAAACKEDNPNPDDGNQPTATDARRKFDTVHDFSSTVSDYDFIKDGQTEYVLVRPAEESTTINDAVSEFNFFFEMATGFRMPVVNDTGLTYTEDAKYISVGKTTLLEQAGIALDLDELGDGGYVIITKGRSVFLAGGQFGDIWSVYEFLRQHFNLRVYTKDEILIDTDVTDEKLINFNVKDIPDVEYRVANYGEALNNAAFGRRMRMMTFSDVWINTWHNFFQYVPKDRYQADHPDWYSLDGMQLCFTRDPDGLLEAVLETMKQWIDGNPNRSNLTFTAEDYNVWCTCESCQASKEKYGANSACYVQFVNRVAKEIKKWLDEERGGRKMNIAIFAYHQTTDAPCVSDGNGGWKPVDDSVILEDNIVLFYAPIFANYYYDFYHPMNKTFGETLDKWSVLADTIYMWTYSTNFSEYFLPFDTFNSMQGLIQFGVEHNNHYIFDQGQHTNAVAPDWGRLKLYLNSRLEWDCQLDMNELIDDFFENYFKAAAEPMKNIFDKYRTYYAYLAENFGVRGSVQSVSAIKNSNCWPLGTLNSFLEDFDKAYASIEYLKDVDEDLYDTLYDRICLESITFRYLKYSLYPSAFSAAEYDAWREQIRLDCIRIGVSNFSEFTTVADSIIGG